MSKKKMPCIGSSNPKFIKKGCPQEPWDSKTGEGCPKWKKYYQQQTPGGPQTLLIEGCVDMLAEHWAFEGVRLAETLIKTNENFRDGMIGVSTKLARSMIMGNTVEVIDG